MALKNLVAIIVIAVSLVSVDLTNAQLEVPGPNFRPKPVESHSNTRPLVTPGIFDYDTRAFAPLEFTNGKEKEPNTGFYFTLDRVYTSVSRANHQDTTSNAVQTGSDYIWGNRYEIGWFSDADEGWNIAYQDSRGSYFTAGQDALVSNPMLVETQFSTVEINRMFRQVLSQGGYFEPYLGARFNSVSDNTLEDTTQTLGGVVISNRFKQNATNNAFGIQAGGRYNQRRGRWRTTGDVAVATLYNQQRYFATDIAFNAGTVGVTESYDSDQSFVPVLDAQVEFSYNISRDIAIRTGLQAMYAWNGFTRANTLTTNLNGNSNFGIGSGVGISDDDESYLAAGFLFGVEWRR